MKPITAFSIIATCIGIGAPVIDAEEEPEASKQGVQAPPAHEADGEYVPKVRNPLGSGVPVIVSYRGFLSWMEAGQAKPVKAGAGDLIDPIVRKFFAEIEPGYNRDSKFNVTEYEIEGLWEALGIQLFLLDCGPGHRVEVFAAADGGLRFLPLNHFGGSGIEEVFLSDGVLYFTSHSGSGTSRTRLSKISRVEDAGSKFESLGFIATNPPGEENKELVKKMAGVIARLNPVKLGEKNGPAPAPAAEKPGKE